MSPMNAAEIERELCRLAARGVEEEPSLPPAAGAHDFLLALESLALTLDDKTLRGRSLVWLALVRLERGESERAEELGGMAARAGAATAETDALLGKGDAAAVLGGLGPSRSREARGWLELQARSGAAVDLGFLEGFDDRIRALVLLENAKLLAKTSAAARTAELARGLLGSDSPLVVCAAVEALSRARALGADDAAAARARLLRATLPVEALDALVSLGRALPLEEPDTGDLRADAVVRLAQARRAAEEGELEPGRDLLHKVFRLVTDLRVKHRRVEATQVFVRALPVAAALHPRGEPLLEGLVEDSVLKWVPVSASETLTGLAVAATRLARAGTALELLELEARLAVRRMRSSRGEAKEKSDQIFFGLASIARVAGTLGDPRAVVDRIAAGARERLLEKPRDPSPPYRALLGCGEALARRGDRAALAGAIDALAAPKKVPLGPLLDEALYSADEVDDPELRRRVLEVARPRLDEPEVAQWLASVALRAGEIVGQANALDRWRRAEEGRRRARLTAQIADAS